MKNIDYKILDGKLQITIDLAQSVGKTARGNDMVATSGNWQKIETDQGKLSLNLVLVGK